MVLVRTMPSGSGIGGMVVPKLDHCRRSGMWVTRLLGREGAPSIVHKEVPLSHHASIATAYGGFRSQIQ